MVTDQHMSLKWYFSLWILSNGEVTVHHVDSQIGTSEAFRSNTIAGNTTRGEIDVDE